LSLISHDSRAVRLVITCMLLLPLNGCIRFPFQVEETLRNHKAASVTKPVGQVAKTAKPLQSAVGVAAAPPQATRNAPVVDQILQSRQTPYPADSIGIVPLAPVPRPSVNAFDAQPLSPQRPALVATADSSYENATISEDVTWRGTVLIRGGLVIASQATVRIEAGTVVRFMKSVQQPGLPRMVVKGRLQSAGTPELPVLFAPNTAESVRDDWGGILFLASEKRNQLDHTRIEGAETGIEARFSTLAAKGVTVVRSSSGMSFRDSTVSLTDVAVSGCETGLEIRDSELELRGGSIVDNRLGVTAQHASLALSSLSIKGSERQGILAEECRIKFNACDLTGNAVGAQLKGGEGQVLMGRFAKNREAGLRLAGARIKVYRCLFADNLQDGIQVEDGRSAIWENSFSANGGFNLANIGRENVSAVLNWWGTVDENAIHSKLLDARRDVRSGQIAILPWLTAQPATLP